MKQNASSIRTYVWNPVKMDESFDFLWALGPAGTVRKTHSKNVKYTVVYVLRTYIGHLFTALK